MSPRSCRASRLACTYGTRPSVVLSLRKGWVSSSFFLSWYATNTIFRASSRSFTAPLTAVSKSPADIWRRFRSDSVSRSARTGRNSSMRSSARLGRPGRSRCKNPTAESSPTVCFWSHPSRCPSPRSRPGLDRSRDPGAPRVDRRSTTSGGAVTAQTGSACGRNPRLAAL